MRTDFQKCRGHPRLVRDLVRVFAGKVMQKDFRAFPFGGNEKVCA